MNLKHQSSSKNGAKLPGKSLSSPSKNSLRDQKLDLSAREHQILALVCQGQRNKAIAENLGISVNTVCTHLKHVFKKLQVNSRVEAVMRYDFRPTRTKGQSQKKRFVRA